MIPHISGTLYRRSPNDSSVLLTKIQHISQIFKINGFDLDFSVEYCNIDSALTSVLILSNPSIYCV